MNMKNKIKVLIGFSCLCGAYYLSQPTEVDLTDLAFDNIEALASGEGSGNMKCYGVGDIDCLGYKVEEKVTDLR